MSFFLFVPVSEVTVGMSADIHFQALCSAVEHERIDKCKSILQVSLNP